MLDLNKVYIATAVTDNEYKDVVKILASSFTRFNPSLTLNVYCLNFTQEAYDEYVRSVSIDNVVFHRVTYNNPYTDPNSSNYYMTILDSIGIKFKIASTNPDCDYMLWLDADTFFCKSIADVTIRVTKQSIYGVPRTRNVPLSKMVYNAGVLLFPKRILPNMLSLYTSYCKNAATATNTDALSYSDEYFIRDIYTTKEILPDLFNSTPTIYNDKAIIQHAVGNCVPWKVRIDQIYGTDPESNATRRIYAKWMDAYNTAKPLLSRSFIDMVEGQ